MHIGFAGLNPAVGGTAAISFLEQSGPVLDGAEEVTDVDEVKGVVVPGPAECGIIYLELDIRGDPAKECE